ncbi:hypothetical protein CCMSSC00406_0009100 [Pleurotus cornucopiae]|uniref:Uncharacterized protein n=1 Tax=Pleurotus cornucopiae TaxID=5321 RepID=A0ACB7J9E5_PLECO|nr:hypothetical protein CCMSSC00406_0009100 [Pleurotus cornucopiae]
MNDRVQRAPFQVNVVRNQLTKGIANFIPEIVDEATLAIEDTFKPPPNSEYASLPVFNTMMYMVGRITSRAIVGVEICRNELFVRTIVRFMKGLVVYSRLLRCVPNVSGLRAIVFFVLSSIWGSSKQAKAFIQPYVAKRMEERNSVPSTTFSQGY